MGAAIVKMNTGTGLVSVGYTPGALAITAARHAPSSARFDVDLIDDGHPYRMDQAAQVKDATDATTYFTGTVVDHPETSRSYDVRTVSMRCEGADVLLRRVRVRRAYTDTAAGDIIKDINTKDLGGALTVTAVVDGPVLEEMVFDGETVFEALGRIEEACSGFVLVISPAMACTFDAMDALTASSIVFTDASGAFDPDSVSVRRSASAYYNRVAVIAPAQAGREITESLDQDKDNTYFALKHPISTFLNDGDNKIYDSVNAVSYNARRRGYIAASLSGYDFDWEPKSSVIRRIVSLGLGAVLEVSYVPKAPPLYVVHDKCAIDARGGYPAGVFEHPPIVLDRFVPFEEMVAIALSTLRRHNRREAVELQFTTTTIETSGTLIYPGEPITVDSDRLGISGTYQVQRVVYTDRIPGEWTMTITATLGLAREATQGLGKALRQSSSKADAFVEGEAAGPLFMVPIRSDIEAVCLSTFEEV